MYGISDSIVILHSDKEEICVSFESTLFVLVTTLSFQYILSHTSCLPPSFVLNLNNEKFESSQ